MAAGGLDWIYAPKSLVFIEPLQGCMASDIERISRISHLYVPDITSKQQICSAPCLSILAQAVSSPHSPPRSPA